MAVTVNTMTMEPTDDPEIFKTKIGTIREKIKVLIGGYAAGAQSASKIVITLQERYDDADATKRFYPVYLYGGSAYTVFTHEITIPTLSAYGGFVIDIPIVYKELYVTMKFWNGATYRDPSSADIGEIDINII